MDECKAKVAVKIVTCVDYDRDPEVRAAIRAMDAGFMEFPSDTVPQTRRANIDMSELETQHP